jgi:hypothetical protein
LKVSPEADDAKHAMMGLHTWMAAGDELRNRRRCQAFYGSQMLAKDAKVSMPII